MTTASNAIKACIEDNWNPATGGTEPTVYTSTEGSMWPTEEEWIFVKNWEYGKKRKRRNDSFVKEDDYVGVRVYTRNHADGEERLDEMVNELYDKIKPANVTGYHKVDIIDQHRRSSDRRQKVYAADLIVELKILSTSSTATPGSTTTSTAEFDELTVNTWIKGVPLIEGPAGADFEIRAKSGRNLDLRTGATYRFQDIDGNLAASIGGVTGDGYFKGDMTVDGILTTATQAQIDALLMFGSANAAYVPMALAGANQFAYTRVSAGWYVNLGANNVLVDVMLPKPTGLGSLKLYISNLKFGVKDADDNDYITSVIIRGLNGNVDTTLDTDNTDHKTVGNKTFAGAVMPAAAIDCSGYQTIIASFTCSNTDAAALDFGNIRMECYYA